MALWFYDLIPNGACLVLCGLGALIGPILLYRYSQCIWLALYYSLVVDELQSAPESTTPTAHPVSSNAAASEKMPWIRRLNRPPIRQANPLQMNRQGGIRRLLSEFHALASMGARYRRRERLGPVERIANDGDAVRGSMRPHLMWTKNAVFACHRRYGPASFDSG